LEWRDIDKDMVVKGKVVEIENFGAFVDIGAERPGLMHISELSRGYVKTTTDVVNLGDEVEVKIIDFNRRKKQIKLSMKALQPEVEEKKKEEILTDRPEVKHKIRKGKEHSEVSVEEVKEEPESTEPELTVMELAWMEAKEKASHKKQTEIKTKKAKLVSDEQTDILSRTLENRR
jgi:small subunit ribosomal protein S1